MRLEKLGFNELKFFECHDEDRGETFFGIKRQAKLHLDKLDASINDNGWAFPLIAAELPNKDKYLIDGYARWGLEEREKKSYDFPVDFLETNKHDALVIPAKDLAHAKELYLQCQSRYGTANIVDFKNLDGTDGYSRYETGLVPPRFDLSTMTREELARAMLDSEYQIL